MMAFSSSLQKIRLPLRIAASVPVTHDGKGQKLPVSPPAYTHETLEPPSTAYSHFSRREQSAIVRTTSECHVLQSGHKRARNSRRAQRVFWPRVACLAFCTALISVSRTGWSKFGRPVTSFRAKGSTEKEIRPEQDPRLCSSVDDG